MTSLVFLACIEPGRLEAQTVLLCRSIRRFAGRHATSRIVALQPQRSSALAEATTRALGDLGVQLVRSSLAAEFPDYPIGNKAFAAEWVERRATEDVIVFADSDSFFLGEPRELELTADAVAGVRPVFQKNVGSSGPEDPFNAYWDEVHRLFGTQPPPFVETTVARRRIHGYWNSGLVAVRRHAGLMRRWREVLERLLRERMIPPNGRLNNLDQVALTVALAPVATTVLDPRYNYPLPVRDRLAEPMRSWALDELIHVHYTRAVHAPGFLEGLRPPLGKSAAVDWLQGQLPLEPVSFATEPREVYLFGDH